MSNRPSRPSKPLKDDALVLPLFDGMEAATRREICRQAAKTAPIEGDCLFRRGHADLAV